MKYFSLVMSLVYVLFGCLFLFTDLLSAQIMRFRIPIGIVLVAYGTARAYLWQRRYNENQEGS